MIPEPDRLAAANSFAEFRELWTKANQALDELEKLDYKLREAYKERRRVALRVQRLRSERNRGGFAPWDNEKKQQAEAKLEEAHERHDELSERIEQLEAEREEFARYIDRNFVGVQTDRDWPDLRPPDEQKIVREVGEPVRGWG